MVEGEIKAQRILVSGSFVGKIEAERLEIVASGKVTGEISVGQLVVESGGHFNGTSRIRGDEPPKQITHHKPELELGSEASAEASVEAEAPITAEPTESAPSEGSGKD